MIEPVEAVHSPLTVAVASGKGGTGKTLVATNLSLVAHDVATDDAYPHQAARRVALVDCDPEGPNDHIFLGVSAPHVRPVMQVVAQVDSRTCDACGVCRDRCAYGAIRVLGSSALVFDELCHGCGVCMRVCPRSAITEVDQRVGEVAFGSSDRACDLSIITGRLDIGHVETPAVIRAARAAASALHPDVVIVDAPPGVACAAVAAVRGVNALLLVTEPTAFGIHDLELSISLGRQLGLPMGVVVNREDGLDTTLDGLCTQWDVPIITRIPFSRRVAEVYARGGLVIDEIPEMRPVFSQLWKATIHLADQAVSPR